MRAFRRLKQTVSVSIESLLDQIENQEAVAAATIREVEHGAARVRMHHKACERRIHGLEQRSTELAAEVQLWRDRARRLKHDRDKALECVRRMRAAETAGRDVERQLEAQQALLQKISEDERVIETKLAELRRRLALLSSREVRTEAESGASSLSDIDAVFDRWEARLEEREVQSETQGKTSDSFARALAEEETQQALNEALDRLLAEEDE